MPRSAAALLAVLALLLGPAGTVALSAKPRPAVTLSVAVGSTLATAGTTRYSGTATTVPAGTPVYLEYRAADHRWYTAAVTATRAHGVFDDTFTSQLTGRTSLRAHLHAAKQTADAVSATRTVTMSRLFHLSEVKPVSISSIDTRPVTLGVTTYPYAIVFIASARSLQRSVERWDLAGRCSLFTSTVVYVNPRQAGSGARGDAAVDLDGAVASTAAILPTDGALTLSAPVRDTRTLELSIVFAGKDEESRIAWLDPRLLCSADPGHG